MTSTRRISGLSTMPPAKPGDGADERADEHADRHAREADQERRAGAVDDEREHVALEAAGLAHRMRSSRVQFFAAASNVSQNGGRPVPTTCVGVGMSVKLNGRSTGPMTATRRRTPMIAEPDEGQVVLAELAPGELPLVERLEADLVVLGGPAGPGRSTSAAVRPAWLDVLGHGGPQYLMRGSTMP